VFPKRFLPKDMSRVVYTGMPVRPQVAALAGAPYPDAEPEGPLRLLVFGGSQGARAFSEIVPPAIGLLAAHERARLDIAQQCRPEDLERVRSFYAELGVKAELAAFFVDLPERIARTHFVIGRSGAGTVSELMVIGRPALLVPLPHALDDNQTPNADAFVEAGGGWRVSQKELTPKKLADMLAFCLSSPADLAAKAAAVRLRRPPSSCSPPRPRSGRRWTCCRSTGDWATPEICPLSGACATPWERGCTPAPPS